MGHLEQMLHALTDMTELARQLPTSSSSLALASSTSLSSLTTAAGDSSRPQQHHHHHHHHPYVSTLPSSEVVALSLALLCRILHAFLSPPSLLVPPAAVNDKTNKATTEGTSASSSSSTIASRAGEEIAKASAALIAVPKTVMDGLDALFCLAKVKERSRERERKRGTHLIDRRVQ